MLAKAGLCTVSITEKLDCRDVPLVPGWRCVVERYRLPAAPDWIVVFCVQKVLPTEVSTHWWTRTWFVPTVRAIPLSQSLPTPKTSEPCCVVFSETGGAPLAPLPVTDAPTPCVICIAITVSDWWYPRVVGVDVIVTLLSGCEALAFQISASPD